MKMEKTYDHKKTEEKIYKMWEEGGYFEPENCPNTLGETYCILMPPPNANAPMHCGHATYSIQDLMARLKRMQGYKVLYVPGTDHAGFETQVVYERELKEKGKSRFDFDTKTLYNQIFDFVKENSGIAIDQMRRLGMSCAWSRNTFMLDDFVIDTVYNTFFKMHEDGLIYKDYYLVNYSPHHGTTFSNLETEHIEETTPLYFVKYKFTDSDDFITVATTRPETIYADVAVAVNPKDKRYVGYEGRMVVNPLNGKEIPVIEDGYVDVEFGTGALKITPGHDFNDYEIGRTHNLEAISLIDLDGNLNENAGELKGMTIDEARKKTEEILDEKGAVEKIDRKYTHNLLVDYKDKKPIEPMLLSNWFVKMEGITKKAVKAIESGRVQFNLPTWEKQMLHWLGNIRDWPISRQIVFGIRIPVWYSVHENPDLHVVFLDRSGGSHEGKTGEILNSGNYTLEEISDGLQKLITGTDAKYVVSKESPGEGFLQETDTFDTWFSSGQWPLTTLKYPDGNDFEEFFPTDFMDSMWDILFFWIARMIIFSLYLTGEVPYKMVYIHGRIDDEHGKKMSKSLGNVIDPMKYIEEYGADALRMGILVGGNTAAKTTSFSSDKVRGYRNFANKIWNISRFMLLMFDEVGAENVPFYTKEMKDNLAPEDEEILKGLEDTILKVDLAMERYKFTEAGDLIYHFMWDELAAKYIERVKDREDKKIALSVLRHVFINCLKLLHPYMPFVTEEIWSKIPRKDENPLIISKWPKVK